MNIPEGMNAVYIFLHLNSSFASHLNSYSNDFEKNVFKSNIKKIRTRIWFRFVKPKCCIVWFVFELDSTI